MPGPDELSLFVNRLEPLVGGLTRRFPACLAKALSPSNGAKAGV